MCCNAIQSAIQLDSMDMQRMLQFDHSDSISDCIRCLFLIQIGILIRLLTDVG